MKILSFTSQGREIDQHGSIGAAAKTIIPRTDSVSVVTIQLDPHGILGSHPAAADQLFMLVAGDGYVSTQGETESFIRSGNAVYWRKGEIHHTRAGNSGLLAVVIEGEGLGASISLLNGCSNDG